MYGYYQQVCLANDNRQLDETTLVLKVAVLCYAIIQFCWLWLGRGGGGAKNPMKD